MTNFKLNSNTLKMLRKSAQQAAKNSADHLCTLVKNHSKRDTGALAASYHVWSTGESKYRIGSNLIQAWIAEYGRTPGAPPPPSESLRPWAERKGLLNNETEKQQKSTLYVLARAIGRDGLPARSILSETFAREKGNLVKLISKTF